MTDTMHRAHSKSREAAGFTLVELLVVILIIGILAAIALPAFLGHLQKARDSKAKSNARNLVSQIEACWHNAGGYVGCAAALTVASTSLPIGGGPGEVQIVAETATGYEIVAVSEAQTGGVNHSFAIVHNIGGVFDHDCAVRGAGGCPLDGDW